MSVWWGVARWLGVSAAPGCVFFFFFNDTATTEIYTLSLHDALPISSRSKSAIRSGVSSTGASYWSSLAIRSEEHTSELQSPCNLVCRLLLEKKNTLTPTPRNLPARPAPPLGPPAPATREHLHTVHRT